MSDTDGTKYPLVAKSDSTDLVVRSDVPKDLKYLEYKPFLRHDFYHSCAYCTMSEAEAQAIRFTIDHYEPRKARPDLQHEYNNLMYSCNECNLRKGDRSPPAEARADGIRFFRPDCDRFDDHFQRTGIRLESKSNMADYTIDSLDLNRLGLRRLREIRERLTKCAPLVSAGILALRKFHIDQLPSSVKGSAARAIQQAHHVENRLSDEIDTMLREFARSPFLDIDPDSESRTRTRIANLKRLGALYPGNWRAPRTMKQKKARKKNKR